MLKDKWLTLALAFITPVLLMLPAFAAAGIFPFGDKSLLIVDMHNEYIDYLAQMNETVRFSGSFLRSWNMGLGLNMLGLIAFYTSSPFNIIILLLPLSVITEAVFAVTLLKLGTAGLFFAIFAREIFPEANRSLHVAFSVAYALMGYNIAYSSNIMWLDGAAFLPLVILGAERLLRYGRCKTFLFSLIYVFFTSYYIGYMIGIFAFLYFTASWFSKADLPWKTSIRAYARMLPRFFGSAALAAGSCAFLLLPAFLNLKDGQSEMWTEMFEFKLSYPAVRIASKLLPGVYDSLTDSGLPNIYCTLFAVTLCAIYFCAKVVPLREKLIFGGLLGFILFSFSCDFIYYAWHAFEVPTWFPARYSFVFSFFALFLALRCACVLERVSLKEVSGATALLTLIIAEISANRFRFMKPQNIAVGFSLVILYAVLFALWKKRKRHILSALVLVLVCMEAFGGAAFTVLGMDTQFGYKSRAGYRDFMQSYGSAVEKMKTTDPGVYRSEILGARNANGGMALGYNGISHYSTTTDQKLNRFLRSLGYNKGTANELRFSASTPVTNGLLGIKYVLSKDELDGAYVLLEKAGDVNIYENTAAFPLAFWAPPESQSFEPDISNPFQLQNRFISALTGKDDDIFLPVSVSAPKLVNAERIKSDGHIQYARQIRNQAATVEFYTFNPNRNESYAFFPVYDDRFSTSEVFVDGVYSGIDFAYRSNSLIPLGSGENSTLTVLLGGERIVTEAEYFAALDLEAAKKAAETAAQYQMQFTKFLDTAVEGAITAPQDGLLATTFPFDSGWIVKIDGKQVEQIPLAGVFLAVPVTAGEHSVVMRYVPRGFVAGLAVTSASVLGMVLFFSFAFFNKRKNKSIA